MFRAHHGYEPKTDFEHTDITLHIGDIVTNVEYLDNGWSIGYNVSTQNAGIFPRRNIRPVQDDNISIFPPAKPKSRPVFTEERVEEYVQSDEIVNWWRVVDREALKQAYYRVVHTKRHQYKILKACVGFIAGILLGVLAFIGLKYALNYPDIVAASMASIIGFILIIGLSFSTKCRAVVCLCLPTLTTKSGRLMFKTFAISVLLAGPVTNITNNISELASVSSCAGELMANQTEFIRQLAKEPYDNLVDGLKTTVEEIKDSLDVVTQFVKPVQEVLTGIDKVRGDIQATLTKAKNDCNNELQNSVQTCETKINEASRECTEFVRSASNSFDCGAVNQQDPFACTRRKNSATAACNLISPTLCEPVSTVRQACDGLEIPLDIVDFGGEIEAMRKALSTNVTIRNTVDIGNVNTSTTQEEVVQSIKAELQERTKVIIEIFDIVNWIVSLSILLVVIQAYLYLRKYMAIDKHDNVYITKGFVLVDLKRSKKGKWSLLPLTPKERKLVTDKRQKRMSGMEMKAFCTGFLPIMLNIIGGAAVVAFDYLLYEAILLTNKHGGVKLEFKEKIDIGIEVEDGGLLSKFLNKLVGNFMSVKTDIDHTVDFGQCLAKGIPPQESYLIGLGCLYLVLIFVMLTHAYSLRLRHALAGYFYPEREKDRIRFLHRKLLRRRVITVKELKDVLMIKRQNQESNMLAKDILDDLKSSCKCSKYHDECFICDKKTLTEDLHWCDQCNSYFCEDCFNITINQICPCNPQVSLTYDHVTESDFEDSLQEQIVEEYYSYADGRIQGGSHDESFNDEETNMNGHPDDRHHQRQSAGNFFRQTSLLN